MSNYAKIVIKGSPITKSNFKLHNINGRAILPHSSGKYHDRYALYEQEIALLARNQNPDITFYGGLIALLKVYYKSEKRHPDTINITKSIFDGIEKSGLIVNDAQITKIFTEEYYDKENPRFELELFSESEYNFNYTVTPKNIPTQSKLYSPIKKNLLTDKSNDISSSVNSENKINSKYNNSSLKQVNKISRTITSKETTICDICNKIITSDDYLKADGGKTLICKKCFNKMF